MRQRVVVIGAGIVGASIAYHLAKVGADVVVVERARPASAASGRSFGWINANFAETPDYHGLRVLAIEAWRELEREPIFNGQVRWGGSLAWEGEDPELDAQYRDLNALGYDAEMIGGDAFSALEPNVADPPSRCLHCPSEGAVDAVSAAEAFLKAAGALGARRLIGCEAAHFIETSGRVTGVSTNFGPLDADAVVVAAGVASQALLQAVGASAPMENKAGLIVRTPPLPAVISHTILTPEIHFRQEADGRIFAGEIFSGGGEHLDLITTEPLQLAAMIIDRLRDRLPSVPDIALEEATVGYRPTPADGMPIVGEPRKAPGLYVATMHSGVTLAPLIGRLAASEITSGDLSNLLAPYRIERFAQISE